MNVLDKIESLAKELPRYAPSTELVLKIKSSIHGQSKAERRTEFGPVLDIDELAEFLRVSKDIIEQYLDDIPCFELGEKILFRKKGVEKWIEGREKDFGFQMFESTESQLNKILAIPNTKQGGKRWAI